MIKVIIVDGFVKSHSAVLRFIFRHCSVRISTLHSSRLKLFAESSDAASTVRNINQFKIRSLSPQKAAGDALAVSVRAPCIMSFLLCRLNFGFTNPMPGAGTMKHIKSISLTDLVKIVYVAVILRRKVTICITGRPAFPSLFRRTGFRCFMEVEGKSLT